MRWTRESALAVAQTCEGRGDLHRRHSGLYKYLRRHDLLDDVFPPPTGWTDETALAEVSGCKTRRSARWSAIEYLRRRGLLDDVFPITPRIRWTDESARAVAQSCKGRHDLLKKYPGAYKYLRRHGLLEFALQRRDQPRPVTLPAMPWAVTCPVCGCVCPPDRVAHFAGVRFCGAAECCDALTKLVALRPRPVSKN